MSEKRPSVLIGIPSFRRPEGLRRLLDSITAQQNLDDVDIAVFVGDNDPKAHQAYDIVKDLADTFRWDLACKIIEEPGLSAVRNAILDQARNQETDFLAMLDDDEVAGPDWLSELLDCQRRYDADIVGGPVDFDFEEQPPISVRRCGIFDVPRWKEGPVPLLYATGNVLIRTQALQRAGWPLFDPSFGLTGGEDGEFLRRLRKENTRFAWSPTAIARESVPSMRAHHTWVIRRSLRKGNINMRIEQFHGGRVGIAISFGKAIAWLGSAPLGILLLAIPSRRLWIVGKWSQSVGKIAAILRRSYPAYGNGRTSGIAP